MGKEWIEFQMPNERGPFGDQGNLAKLFAMQLPYLLQRLPNILHERVVADDDEEIDTGMRGAISAGRYAAETVQSYKPFT